VGPFIKNVCYLFSINCAPLQSIHADFLRSGAYMLAWCESSRLKAFREKMRAKKSSRQYYKKNITKETKSIIILLFTLNQLASLEPKRVGLQTDSKIFNFIRDPI
jgi:hypothetical protein